MSNSSLDIDKIRKENLELKKEVGKLNQENQKLKKENEDLQNLIKRLKLI
jgi:cell division protein FtsB